MNIRWLFLFLFGPLALIGQISFLEADELTEDLPRRSGLPLAVIDMNNDLLDDVVLLEKGVDLYIAYQNGQNGGYSQEFIMTVGENPQWSMVVGDIDKNGWNDVIIAGAYDHLKVLYQDSGTFTFSEMRRPDLFAQAMNLVDINGDGWLDLFVCNDIGYNEVFWNLSGTLQKDKSDLFQDLSVDDAKGNYGSEWVDVDGDGDQDLHVSKCYAGSADPDHPARVNRLYINQGDGTFLEEGKERGLANGAQSWTGHWTDIDTDGDFDILVTNHDRDAQLFLNDGQGYFEDVTMGSGLEIGGPVIQSLARDLDCDGLIDIVVGGFPDYLYRNLGNNTFQEVLNAFGTYDMTSLACGDLDNDGRYDLYSAHLGLINRPTSRVDKIYYNRSTNHFVNVYLQDDKNASPANGVKVVAFADGRSQIHQIRNGESYGIQNSQKIVFGLGDQESLDSILIEWPSGIRQMVHDVMANSYIVAHAEGRVLRQQDMRMPLKDTICTGGDVMLTGPSGGERYYWNGIEGTRDISIDQPGFYQLVIHYNDGDTVRLPGVRVEDYDFGQPSMSILQGDTINCSGEKVQLTYNNRDVVLWSTGDRSKTLSITKPGFYTAIIETKCRVERVGPINIDFLDPEEVEVVDNEGARQGEDAIVRLESEAQWYARPGDSLPIAISDTLVINNLQADTTIYAAGFDQFDYEILPLGKRDVDAEEPYHSENLNGTMLFDVQRPVWLRSFDVKTDVAGRRRFILIDEFNGTVDSYEMVLESGWNNVPVNFSLHPDGGLYRLTTDEKVNREVLGTRAPRLESCDSNIDYPYIIDGVIRLLVAQYGFGTYNYFYNWRVQPQPLKCEGPREPITIRLNSGTPTREVVDETELRAYPNPSSGRIYLEGIINGSDIQISDLLGRTVDYEILSINESSNTYDIYINVKHEGIIIIKVGEKIVKMVVRE